MRVHHLLSISLLFVAINTATARTVPRKPQPVWVNDGVRSCTFDDGAGVVKCTEYHQTFNRWMWKSPDGHEVRYTSRAGLVGVGDFTIGELFDRRSKLPGHGSKHAVSYSPSRTELVIGVPGEGYEFSVKDDR